MAEEQKSILDQAKEMLGGAKEQGGDLMGKAKEFIGDKASDMLENADELKKKVVDVAKSITPDSLDDKVEGLVGCRLPQGPVRQKRRRAEIITTF